MSSVNRIVEPGARAVVRDLVFGISSHAHLKHLGDDDLGFRAQRLLWLYSTH